MAKFIVTKTCGHAVVVDSIVTPVVGEVMACFSSCDNVPTGRSWEVRTRKVSRVHRVAEDEQVCVRSHPTTPHLMYRDHVGVWYCPMERDYERAVQASDRAKGIV